MLSTPNTPQWDGGPGARARAAHEVSLPAPFYNTGDHVAIDLPGARAVFTTRRGGCSDGAYASLNLGRLTDDRPDHVERNRRKLGAELGIELSWSRQVHGSTVARVTIASGHRGPVGEADGQATALSGIGPMVLTADCLPIAIAGEGAVAVVHAGWRGLAGEVVAEGVRAVRELGATGHLAAAIGPGAGPCCYQVGAEVHAVFASYGDRARGERRGNLDLKAIARAELEAAGAEVVHDVGLCTLCSDPSLFFSHRRDHGVTGRQAGIAWLT
jgi:polyphenol oxidase